MIPPDRERRTGRGQRGATLLEIMLSMAVVLVGMLVLFRVLGVASQGTHSSQRMTQALSRGQQVMEAMRTAPPSVLDCLALNRPTSWATCEQLCLQWLRSAPAQTAVPSNQACVFSTLGTSGQDQDGSQQRYAVVYDAANFVDRSSWVQNFSLNRTVYDAQVTIGWRDDGTASQTESCVTRQHCVTVRTSIYRDPR